MPLSFPSNPSVNQTSTQNGRVYRWSGSAWEFQTATSPNVLAWTTAPALPTATGTAGQVAYDSQGFLYLCTAANTWVRYTGATWVPPDPLFSNVILLLHGDTGIADSSSGVRAGTNNGTTISSTRKFGAGSLSINGGNVSFASQSAFDMGTAWTVEAWVYIPSFGTDAGLACRGDFNNSNQWDGLQFAIRIGGNASVTTYFWGSGGSQQIVDVPNVLQEATWHHIAAVRDGAVGRVYVDGSLIGSRSDLNSPVSSTYPIIVGKWTAFRSGSGGLQGLIDDFRVTKAARYSGSTFTPPTAAFPDS